MSNSKFTRRANTQLNANLQRWSGDYLLEGTIDGKN